MAHLVVLGGGNRLGVRQAGSEVNQALVDSLSSPYPQVAQVFNVPIQKQTVAPTEMNCQTAQLEGHTGNSSRIKGDNGSS